MYQLIKNTLQDIKKFLINEKNNAITINIILLSALTIADIERIFDADLRIYLRFIFQEYYTSLLIISILFSIILITYIIKFFIKIKYEYQTLKKFEILILITYLIFPLPFSIVLFFFDHSANIYYTTLYGIIPYIFGVLTSYLYYLFLNNFYPYIINFKYINFKCKLISIFLIALILIYILNIINNFGPIDSLKEIPLFTTTHGLLGSFLGSELLNLYKTRKQNTK